MKYLFDPSIGVRAFESDGSQDFLITPEMRLMTEEEVQAHLNPAIPIDWPKAIADRRYEAEIAGAILNGLQINTDDRSKLLINGAALEATINPAYAMQWKTDTGFVDLSAEQVIGVARAVRAHVQACFDREAELLSELGNGTLTEAALAAFWAEPVEEVV